MFIILFCEIHHTACLATLAYTFYYNRLVVWSLYGAQNEAYMSRLAEKWVRGLCFNELGVSG